MSMRPNLSSPALTTREMSSALVRSAGTVTTGVPVVLVISSPVALSDLLSRAHNTNPAPSAASSSATARPRPLLDPAMRAILSLSPKSIGHISDWLYVVFQILKAASLAKIIIRLIQPVLPRRAKNVNVYRILERLGLVFHERRDVQYFTGA